MSTQVPLLQSLLDACHSRIAFSSMQGAQQQEHPVSTLPFRNAFHNPSTTPGSTSYPAVPQGPCYYASIISAEKMHAAHAPETPSSAPPPPALGMHLQHQPPYDGYAVSEQQQTI